MFTLELSNCHSELLKEKNQAKMGKKHACYSQTLLLILVFGKLCFQHTISKEIHSFNYQILIENLLFNRLLYVLLNKKDMIPPVDMNDCLEGGVTMYSLELQSVILTTEYFFLQIQYLNFLMLQKYNLGNINFI